MATAAEFKQLLGAEVARRLGHQFKFYKSRTELRAEVADGSHVIIIAGSNKYSPFVGVDFYFGKCFSAARAIEKQLRICSLPYHVEQYSINFQLRGYASYHGPCTWSVDINDPPGSLVDELVVAIQGIALPFWEKYGTMVAAREAIAADDRDVFGGRLSWGQLLRLDLALDDLEHFRAWSAQLDDLSRKQVKSLKSSWCSENDA